MSNPKGTLSQEELEAQATEKGITVEELQAELNASETDLDEEAQGILDKYASDPKALAKALKNANQGVTKKIQEEIDKRKDLEDENQRLKQGKKEIDPKDLKSMFKKKLKPVYNSETGEWETSDEALEAMATLSDRIASNKMKPVYERLAQSAVREQKAELRNLPHFRDLEGEIDKLLAKMPIDQRMQEGSVMAVYKYAIGEKTIVDAQDKANQRPDVKGDITPHKSSGGAKTNLPKKLSPEQLVEWDKNWKGKGFDEEDYLDLLNRMIEQDKSKGFKVKRALIDQTVSS